MITAYLGIGANLGKRLEQLRTAREKLGAEKGITLLPSSPLYETDPVGGPAGQARYLNGVIEIGTSLEATELLATCRRIEGEAGRTRTVRHGPRTLDLDLLLYGEHCLDTPQLTLPHARMHERKFVLAPLCDLVPESHHPTLHRCFAALLVEVDDQVATLAYKDW